MFLLDRNHQCYEHMLEVCCQSSGKASKSLVQVREIVIVSQTSEKIADDNLDPKEYSLRIADDLIN